MTNKTEKMKFDAEISKVLDLMIHSLYTNKEIFLRELLSNASDACDKLRYLINTDEKLAQNLQDQKFKISIATDSKAKTLTISDNGVGMSKEEMISNLGTIARSGTERFAANIAKKDDAKNNELIGQFGVGFYSSFMVANKVEVVSSKAGEEKTYLWQSSGKGEFEIQELDEQIRGTKITLHLKEEEIEFLDSFRIKNIVTTYSEHIPFTIELIGQKDEKDSKDDKTEIANEILNSGGAIWTKDKSSIKKEDYEAFYKSLSHDIEAPYLTLHNKAEGILEYTNLLFVPNKKPFDLFHPDRKSHIKLYAKKIFITEENVKLLPSYLRFVRGVVDSSDLTLNVSRETLQSNAIITKISSAIVKKILNELKKKFEKDRATYEIFWDNFGAVIKEGLCEYTTNKEKILDISLFKSLKFPEKYISINDYLENIKKDQKEIYYLIGSDINVMKNSPQLEGLKEKDVDVLFFLDGVDDFWVTTGTQYKEKDFKSVTRISVDDEANDDKKDKKDDEKESVLSGLLAYLKDELKNEVADVKISKKLTSSPVCLVAGDSGMDIRIERMLREQGQLKEASKKILEINKNHRIVKNLDNLFKTDKIQAKEIAFTLFDQACILEGESIKDPISFSQRITRLLEKAS